MGIMITPPPNPVNDPTNPAKKDPVRIIREKMRIFIQFIKILAKVTFKRLILLYCVVQI